MSNVTPIRSGGNGSSSGTTNAKKARLARKPKAGVLLSESGEFDGFSTQDVINGLHGICTALASDPSDVDEAVELSIAAKVLSSILQNRVASPKEVRL